MSERLASPVSSAEHRPGKIVSVDDVIDFFISRWEDPDYTGYSIPAVTLKEQLDYIAQKAREYEAELLEGKIKEVEKVDLELRPLSDGDPYYVEGAQRPGTEALISLAYKATGAESDLLYYADDEIGLETAILHGRYDQTDIYFLETRYQGYMRWELMTGVPEGFLSSVDPRVAALPEAA